MKKACSPDRLPLPTDSLWNYIAESGEREMRGMYQGFLICCSIEEPTPCSYDLLRSQVVLHIPVWLLQMNLMDCRVTDAQQLPVVRNNGNRHMPRSVARCPHSPNTRYDFLFNVDKFKLILNWQKVIACALD